jgi:hypothetical protein
MAGDIERRQRRYCTKLQLNTRNTITQGFGTTSVLPLANEYIFESQGLSFLEFEQKMGTGRNEKGGKRLGGLKLREESPASRFDPKESPTQPILEVIPLDLLFPAIPLFRLFDLLLAT